MITRTKPRYIVDTAPTSSLQTVLDNCPPGYMLHSFQSFNSGGNTLHWTVVFERDFE